MTRFMPLALGSSLVLMTSAPALAQLAPELSRRGRTATALVEVTHDKLAATGSAFCIDPSGLFITNAHVAEDTAGKEGAVRLVLDIGLETQRILPAKILKRDDEVDLALLQDAADPRLAPLELGQDASLHELAEVVTFGYPFGKEAAVGRAEYPDITILPSRITSLRRDTGRLATIQFDNQLNPGNSGGPVLDRAGKLVGVARASVLGAALNLAIPVGRLAEFLTAPGLVFDPPEFSYLERVKPATWTIQVQPALHATLLPDGLAVTVTLSNGVGPTRTVTAQRVGVSTFRATVTPVTRDPDWRVELTVATGQGSHRITMRVSDQDVRGGATRYLSSILRTLLAGRSPRAATAQAPAARGPNLRLARATTKSAQKTTTLDLNQAEQIDVWTRDPPREQTVVAHVEARQGDRVLATVRRRTKLEVPKGLDIRLKENVVVVIAPRPLSPPVTHRPPVEEGRLNLGGMLDADGIPLGSGKSIRPPAVAIPSARLAPETTDAPLVRRLEGTISDVAVGGAGRYLLLTLRSAQKLAVFDVNAADVVKTIDLPSPNAMVAAGARKFLIAFPEERVIQRWDLATLRREGRTRPSPIDGRLIRLALGSDSDGPALAFWSHGARGTGREEPQFSFIDLDSLTVPRVGLLVVRGARGTVSLSGGSFAVNVIDERAHLRAAAGGALFGVGAGAGHNGFATLAVSGRALIVPCEHIACGYVAPGPDGRTLFTGLMGRLDRDGKPIATAGPPRKSAPEISIPSSDPAYYLSVSGLADSVTGYVDPSFRHRRSPAGAVTAAIHAADGSRLLTVHGLDEMAFEIKQEDQYEWAKNELTLDKRFHFVPAAHLLITIPAENDRLVLRRLDLDEALDRAGRDDLIVRSPPILGAVAGQTLEHRIAARSRQGGITCTMVSGPEGLRVAPDGQLTWPVPQKLQGQDVTAVVSVKDASGQERSQTLAICVK
jgi:S1-C subfamily serine protease